MKIFLPFYLFFVCFTQIENSHAQIVNTYAGNGISGYSGDGSDATAAQISATNCMTIDKWDNIYFSEFGNNIIRKVSASGIISTYAGNGGYGYTGDGGAADAAQLFEPAGVVCDTFGNLYIADRYNSVIRKVTTSGIISTFAGNGSAGYSGDGGLAKSARLNQPTGVAADQAGNVYIAEWGNNVIRKVNTSGIITTYAGTGVVGYSGDGSTAITAQLKILDGGLATDLAGNLFITDRGNAVIRKVDASGIISTYAGNGTFGHGGDGGSAILAQLTGPTGVFVDSKNNLYISDYTSSRVRKVNATGVISTYAGTGYPGFNGDGKNPTITEFATPTSTVVSANGTVYIADWGNYRIRAVSVPTAILNQNSADPISVYPNPAEHEIYIGTAIDTKSEIVDIHGKKVVIFKGNHFDISDLEAGMFFIIIRNNVNGELLKIQKLIVE